MYKLNELIDKTYQELLDSGLSNKTVYGSYWYIWNHLVRINGGEANFEEEMVYEYCEKHFERNIFEIESTNLLVVEKMYVNAFKKLIQSSKDIPFIKSNIHFHQNFILDERSESLLAAYLKKCKEDGNSVCTLSNKKERIRNFMIDVDFSNLTVDKLTQYLRNRKESTSLVAYTIDTRLIKRFMLFCYEKKEVSKDILLVFPDSMPSVRNKSLPSTYSPDEIKELIESAKEFKHEEYHLRNFAILSLVTFTGIRAGDVVNLQFDNFDWDNSQIRFTQQKTGKEHFLPILPQFGNPIIEYILKERSKIDSKYVFLNKHGTKLKSQDITRIVNVYFENSPIQIQDRHYGPHSLRHSIATNMINKSVPVFSIANTLGHSDTSCVNIYAKVDINGLRKCVLEAPYNA